MISTTQTHAIQMDVCIMYLQDSQSKIICIYLKVTIVATLHFIHLLRQAVVPHKQQSDRPIHRYPVI